jgi:hypothetical protein
VLDGCDVLAVMPTGSGKSRGFQLPAVLLPGITIVVSPFIAGAVRPPAVQAADTVEPGRLPPPCATKHQRARSRASGTPR